MTDLQSYRAFAGLMAALFIALVTPQTEARAATK
jgi:hypothetical protein